METLSDIVAEMRRGTKLPGFWRSCDLNEILKYHADRIEAAWKREREAVEADALAVGGIVEASRHSPGNAAAMRSALVFLRDKELSLLEGNVRHCVGLTVFGLEQACKIMRGMIEEALSAPARNCDVGTPGEQYRRWIHFCEQRLHRCADCPCDRPEGCTFTFENMPYEAQKGAGE